MGEYVELLQTHTGVVGIDETDAARLRAMVMSMALLMCVIAVLEGCNRVLLSLAGERMFVGPNSRLHTDSHPIVFIILLLEWASMLQHCS